MAARRTHDVDLAGAVERLKTPAAGESDPPGTEGPAQKTTKKAKRKAAKKPAGGKATKKAAKRGKRPARRKPSGDQGKLRAEAGKVEPKAASPSPEQGTEEKEDLEAAVSVWAASPEQETAEPVAEAVVIGKDEAALAPVSAAAPGNAGAAPGPKDFSDPAAGPVELSPEEALELLAQMSSAQPEGRRHIADAPAPAAVASPGLLQSILGASCRVLTFESAGVEKGMRVAGAAVERLRRLVGEGGLAVSIGPICETCAAFVAAWDNTPPSMPVAVIANLSCASEFLPGVVEERPAVASAYWIVFETLRSEVSTATSDFLAELRGRNRLRAIGFGPRNTLEAARGGAEAVRGHVEWGFGMGPIATAG